jgi:hypothetical protein
LRLNAASDGDGGGKPPLCLRRSRAILNSVHPSKTTMENRQKVVNFIALKSLDSMPVKELIQFYLEQTKESLMDETNEELLSYLEDYCKDDDGDKEFHEYVGYLEG